MNQVHTIFQALQNSTAMITGTFGDLYSGISLSGILIMLLLAAFFLALTSLRVFHRIRVFFAFMGKTFFHFVEGCAICLTGYAFYSTGLMLQNLYTEGLFKPIWILYGLLGYAGITGLGFLGHKVGYRILLNYKVTSEASEEGVS